MNSAAFRWMLLLMLPLLLGQAQPVAAGGVDSLLSPHLTKWPLATQVKLANRRIDAARAPAIEALVRRPGLSSRVRAQLYFQLGKFYYFDIQPSEALIRFLECQKLARTDAVLQCEVEIELSYAYQWLKQPQAGLRHGHRALRQALALHDVRLINKAYGMLAISADAAGQPALALRYNLLNVPYGRQRHSWLHLAIAQNDVAQSYLNVRRYDLAAQWLDSARQSYAHVEARQPQGQIYNTQFMVVSLARVGAELARHRGRSAEAVRLLTATLPGIRRANDRFLEIDVLKALVPAQEGQGDFRAALGSQRRIGELESVSFEESSRRRAQQLQALYQSREQEQRLAWQQQRIAGLQARTQLREAELTRRTTLFLAVLAGAGLMLVLVVVRQRARRILETTAATLRVRNRIAADLHDEVGTLLTRVNLQAELLRQQQPDPALDRLLTNSRAAASTMRDIVWSIDTQADTIGALLDRMRDHLDQTATPAGLATELHTENLPDATPLTPELRQHLYLIFKEAVTNAAKHAHQATRLRVTLQHEAGQLLLTVQDNGQPAARTSRSGMGLRNMEQRAEALGGTLVAGPHAPGGFRVELRAPF